MTKRLNPEEVRQLRDEAIVDDKTMLVSVELSRFRELCDNLLAVQQESNIHIRDYELLRISHVQAVNDLHEEKQRGTKLTVKQMVLHMLALSEWNPFLSAKRRWDRAESTYAEGVRRGHYPKD